MKTAIHHYIFKEGIGGGETPSFLLLLNGGICKSWSKGNWTLIQARMGAEDHVNQWIANLGAAHVTFTDETREAEEAPKPEPEFKGADKAPAKTAAQYMEDHVQAVRDRLLELNYEFFGSYPEPVKGQKVFRDYSRYLRRADGSQVILYRAYDDAGLAHYEVYKEVSLSNRAGDYLAAIS